MVTRLATRKLYARAIDLPGSGDDETPASTVTLDGYAEKIVTEARAMPPGKLVLVGHSMGGAAITAAAAIAPKLFSRLVYVCAFLPCTGESVATLAAEGYSLGITGPKLEVIENGVVSRLIPEEIAETFLNDCIPTVRAMAIPRFRPQRRSQSEHH